MIKDAPVSKSLFEKVSKTMKLTTKKQKAHARQKKKKKKSSQSSLFSFGFVKKPKKEDSLDDSELS